MQNTCPKEQCPLYKKYKDKCPNFIETGWKAHDSAQPVMIADCAPKRTMLMVQDLYNRFIGIQKSNEEQRNQGTETMGMMAAVINQFMGLMPPKEKPDTDIIDVTPIEIFDKTDGEFLSPYTKDITNAL